MTPSNSIGLIERMTAEGNITISGYKTLSGCNNYSMSLTLKGEDEGGVNIQISIQATGATFHDVVASTYEQYIALQDK